MLSIIIPTLNEESNIGNLLKNISAQDFEDIEVIVVDGNSEDGTAGIVEDYSLKSKKFTIMLAKTKIRNVGFQRNLGAKKAAGDILLFLDADVFLPEGFLKSNISEFKVRKLSAAGCFVKPMSDKIVDKAFMGVLNGYMIICERISPHMPGFCIFAKKAVHEKIRGFNEKIKVSEDSDYVNRARKFGRFRMMKSVNVHTSVRRFEKEGRISLGLKYVGVALYRIFFGEIKTDLFKYEFGHYDKKKAAETLDRKLSSPDGSEIFYRYEKNKNKSSKDRPAIVFLHGWVMNHTAWEDTRLFFAKKGYDTITLDIRGHGMSKSKDFKFSKAADDIRHILKKEGIRSVIIAGYSMGGMIAQQYYSKNRQSVKAMMLVNTTYRNPIRGLPISNIRLMKHLTGKIFQVIRDKREQRYFSKAMVKILSNNNRVLKGSYDKFSKYFKPNIINSRNGKYIDFRKLKGYNDVSVFYEGLAQTDLSTANEFYKEKTKFDTKDQLAKISVPTLIISSRNDAIIPASNSVYMHKRIKNSRLEILDNSDHLSILQETRKINTLMIKFLRKII